MATQTFNLQWDDIPAGKPILSKSEIITYCSHFGQATQNLDFLTRLISTNDLYGTFRRLCLW
jgi:hypothetical protein